jgi:putative hemolysin
VTTNQLLLDAPQHGRQSLDVDLGAGSFGYQVRLATTAEDVLAAQRLRDHVFNLEWGRRTTDPAGLDAEEFDDRCDHLIVWYRSRTGASQAVATCRLLPPHGNDSAPRGSGLAADRIFGLMPLERLLDTTVEVGRACVRADHRAGAAVSLLWGGVARYLHLTGYRYVLGAVPMALQDDGRSAASFWDLALTSYLAPAERRCRPRDPIAIGGLERAATPAIPLLLRGCLRLGAKVCGPPGYDETFGAARFLVLLDTQDVNPRYLRRLLNTDG